VAGHFGGLGYAALIALIAARLGERRHRRPDAPGR
jgi:hypothetical protein